MEWQWTVFQLLDLIRVMNGQRWKHQWWQKWGEIRKKKVIKGIGEEGMSMKNRETRKWRWKREILLRYHIGNRWTTGLLTEHIGRDMEEEVCCCFVCYSATSPGSQKSCSMLSKMVTLVSTISSKHLNTFLVFDYGRHLFKILNSPLVSEHTELLFLWCCIVTQYLLQIHFTEECKERETEKEEGEPLNLFHLLQCIPNTLSIAPYCDLGRACIYTYL